ncbi:TPA: acylneuraminate cytidylyltransferase family protein [Campylobacter coli]|nr:acylneuraminate cytidylyltransferase family protein [Campylobacter coli]HEG0609483.1 acylneuraminate cytidylyltransferase family protein [Campylobacter coli]
MRIKALIPVRSGSQRVKDKNIRPFANSSLLEVKIRQLKRIKEIDSIVVNSNDSKMLDIARSFNVEAIKRDDKFATNDTLANELYVNLAKNIDTDVVLLAHVTSPLISDSTIRKCIDEYKKNIFKHDSLVTVSSVKHFLWLNGNPINYNPELKPRSQDLPDIVSLNHAIHILPRDIMIKKKDIMGYNPMFYEISAIEGMDIDNELDFDIAEFLFKRINE